MSQSSFIMLHYSFDFHLLLDFKAKLISLSWSAALCSNYQRGRRRLNWRYQRKSESSLADINKRRLERKCMKSHLNHHLRIKSSTPISSSGRNVSTRTVALMTIHHQSRDGSPAAKETSNCESFVKLDIGITDGSTITSPASFSASRYELNGTKKWN